MFTGIISGVGRVISVCPKSSGASVFVELCRDRSSGFDLSLVSVGDSVCVSGVCLTVVSVTDAGCGFDVSAETLSCTCLLDVTGALVNLETSLRPSSLVGGHFVYGHVDCVGKIVVWRSVCDSQEMVVSIPPLFAPYIARKCSIAVDGISLTVNGVEDGVEDVRFSVNLIPHTLSHTTSSNFDLSTSVNVEVDMMARYASRCAEVFLNCSRNNGV
ncbi:putative riboflavin synthase alpha chain [Candidatus Ichthyocystis hellenicum]|uniref:Riboflavin synthase n=1 Tax=Candidatus Ichthyocystis hellenicum TaxID=1561003 RepID=A0A0S4M3D4_9BURK|nr:riboflavin synthase [Candidatus Ichthyocystis hellenicum]CUT17378.1 putative riboflavin synthase alpha chain [Candidatus Ichthyocystis hellenicum]